MKWNKRVPKSSSLSEKVDEKESDDTGGTGRGTTGNVAATGQWRSGTVSDSVGLTRNHFTAANDDTHQIADT